MHEVPVHHILTQLLLKSKPNTIKVNLPQGRIKQCANFHINKSKARVRITLNDCMLALGQHILF